MQANLLTTTSTTINTNTNYNTKGGICNLYQFI